MNLSVSSPLSNMSSENAESARLESLYNLRSFPPVIKYHVVKMRNIPFDISTDEIVTFFYPLKIPFGHVAPHYTHCIHIPMQASTGKTISDCFVELESAHDASIAVKLRKFLKGRLISVVETTQEELMNSIFPGMHSNYNSNESFDLIPGLNSCSESEVYTFLSQQEINGILTVCKRFKLHFSRKCAERPFELIISILSKMPWHQTNRISLLQRDHLFEMLKIAAESMVLHLSKSPMGYLEPGLLLRLIRAGLAVPLFTEKQKLIVLSVSNLKCPKDLESFVFNPPQVESDMSPKSDKVTFPSVSLSNLHEKSPASVKPIINSSGNFSRGPFAFQTPLGYSEKFTGKYSSLFENQTHSKSKYNQDFPSPAPTLLGSDSYSPFKAEGKFSPLTSNCNLKGRPNDRISDLEKKVDEYSKKLKEASEELSAKNVTLSGLNERNLKLRDQLRSCLSFIKSLQRRNDELEYIHFKSDKSSWGTDGLHMEYNAGRELKF